MSRSLGRYELLHHLATGGMAEIWLARQHGLGGFQKLVVIKRILPHLAANADFVQMFLDEGRLAAQLDHPNIVQLFDLGQDGRDYFLAMEFVRGENLHFLERRLADRGGMAMPVTYAAKVVSQVCEALYYAHTKTDPMGRPLHLVHRDVSPANLILSYQGQVKVVDFGIAKAANKVQSTRVGMVKGNYGYMSPEQASGRPLDHRSDIFALGIVLWELVTGARLYESDSDLALVRAICEQPPVAPRTMRRGIPGDLDAIVLKALEKNPDRRFQDCHEMHLALERFIHGQGTPVTPVHLARYMQSLFPDRLEAWQKVVQSDAASIEPEVVSQISTVFVSEDAASAGGNGAIHHPSAAAALDDGFDETVQMKVPPELLRSLASPEGRDDAVEAVSFEETVTAETHVPQSLLESLATPPPQPQASPWPEQAPPTDPSQHLPAGDATLPAYPSLPDTAAEPQRRAAPAPAARRAPAPPPPPPPPARAPARASRSLEFPVDSVGPIPDDDDEDDDVPLLPELPLEALLGASEGPASSPLGSSEEKPVCEVLFHQGDTILDSAILRAFQGYRARRLPRLARMGTRTCTVRLPDASQGLLRRARGGQENLQGPAKVVLDENDRLDVEHEGFQYRVRVYRPPAPPRSPRSPFAAKVWGACIGGAVGIHILLLVAFMLSSVVGVKIPVANTKLAERFAEIKTPKQLEHRRVHHRRRHHHHARVIPLRRADPTEAQPQIPKRLQRRIARITRRFRHHGGGRGSGGTTSLLNALRSPVAGNGKTLKDVVSNIDAVGGKAGHSRGAFRVAGTLAALKGGKVNLATGGGGDIGTLSGKEIAGNGVGRLRGRGGGGHVRGRVSGIRALARVSGSLSRAQVLKVINEHLGEIQGCYERALNHHPGLGGKIEFEWTVRANGRVSTARERSSSMNDARVSQCIIHVIRRMRFPRPKGGRVTIAYPFMFRSVPS